MERTRITDEARTKGVEWWVGRKVWVRWSGRANDKRVLRAQVIAIECSEGKVKTLTIDYGCGVADTGFEKVAFEDVVGVEMPENQVEVANRDRTEKAKAILQECTDAELIELRKFITEELIMLGKS